MPFGEKEDIDKTTIDFNEVYRKLIAGALEELDFERVDRADEITKPGPIHRDMISRISDSDVCIVDVTTLNPNVFYELGVRHALCSGITVLIKRKGLKLPFNIGGIRAIEYSMESEQALADSKQAIADSVRSSLQEETVESDSLVFTVLPGLRVSLPKHNLVAPAEPIKYPVRKHPDRYVGVIGGDIRHVKNIPVWVNSENTYMQMARFFDKSVSSTIRYLGAKKNGSHVTIDLIANDLARQVRRRGHVYAGEAIKTTAGELKRRNGVKFLVHVAAVQGTLGEGYSPVPRIERCVENALALLEEERELRPRASVLFPLLGTGTATGKVEELAPRLLKEAVAYLERVDETVIEAIYFSAYTIPHWEFCNKVLQGMRGKRLGDPIQGA
jgi:hypothetical protein